MKTKSIPVLVIATLLAIGITGCGSTKKVTPKTSTSSAAAVAPPAPTPPLPSSPTPSPTGAAPLSYDISRTGTNTYTTNAITTDNILRVKFKVGNNQGNNMHQATWLKVTIAVNGQEVVPMYTSSNYTYGTIGETSAVIDFSANLSPGVPVTILVKEAMNDFYCTYWAGYDPNTWQPINPLYNNYPGCLKAVNSVHTWTGTLTVQTNSTTAI